jgi:hypothetical protein
MVLEPFAAPDSRPDQQLVALQGPDCQPLQVTTPPVQFMQQRCWVLAALCWQYGGVQACARADGSRNSSAALLSRPNDLRMFIEPFAQQRARPVHPLFRVRRLCRCLGVTAGYCRASYRPSGWHR